MAELLELRTFGGLRAVQDGRERAILPDRQSLLLAALIAARGRTVSRTELVDLIWPQDPPGSAVNQVHRYIGALRRVLEPALGTREPGRLIERRNEGYRLRSAEVALDLDAFDGLVLRARGSVSAGDAAEASAQLLQALEIAMQPAFSNLAALPSGHPDLEAIEASRIAAAVLLADAALRAAAPERAIPTVARMAAQAPFNEILQAGYIRLLHAAGRASEALAHYASVAGLLRETFGVDPGPALRSAHLEAVSPVASDAPPAASGRVSNLPPANPSYVDPPRGGARFTQLLDRGVQVGTITVVCGGGGLGKTTLAVHLARLLERRSDASSVFLDLRGFDPELEPVAPEAAIGMLLTQLGVEHVGLSPEAATRALRDVAQRGPLIALLDSARDAEQLRPLLACLSGATVIVTTRGLLQTLVVREGARLVQLDRWDDGPAQDLLAERLGVAGIVEQYPALAVIARACAGLPLALAIAAARCSGLGSAGWEAIALELAGSAGPLDALSITAGSDDVRSVFASSLRALDEDAVTVFRRIALVPEPSADLHALAAVSGSDLAGTRDAIRVLLGSSMLRDAGDGLFTMHDLVRSYALELLGEEERADAESRAVSYVALTARRIWSITGRAFVSTTSPPRVDAGVVPPITDLAQARAWSSRNGPWIDVLSQLGIARGLERDVVTVHLDLRPVSDRDNGHAASLARFAELDGLAIGLDDPALLGEIRTASGFFSGASGHAEEARRHYESAIELFTSIGDAGGIAKTYRNMTADAARRREFADADRFATTAAEFATASGNQSMIASCGSIRLAVLGEMEEFDRIVELAPAVVRTARASSPGDLAYVLERQAFAQYSVGDAAGAIRTARESFALTNPNTIEAVHPLITIALASATLGLVAECRDAIDRFEALATAGPIDFDTHFAYDADEIRGRFTTAAQLLANRVASDDGSPRVGLGPVTHPVLED